MTQSVPRRMILGVAAGMMRRYLALIVVAVLLPGCFPVSVGRAFDAKARFQVQVNATTKEDVRRLFGEPDVVKSDPYRETWTYRYMMVVMEVLAGTTIHATPAQTLQIGFKNGVVVDCNYEYAEMETGLSVGQVKKQITDMCVTPSTAVTSDKREQTTAAPIGGDRGSNPNMSAPLPTAEPSRMTSPSRPAPSPASAAVSLAGTWRGLYSYGPQGVRPVEFTLTVSGSAEGFVGRMWEPATFGNGTSDKLFADISGQVTPSGDIRFTKKYDGTGGVSHSVTYEGSLDEMGRTVEGRWALGASSGVFRMTKQ
jgi:outer membrane protein assembly factor BamE (lipoprotein component of BamABCDE complex)